MVSDRTFLPFFVITFAVIIYSALAFGPRSNSTESPLGGDPLNGFVIANDDLKIIISGPGISRELIDDPVEGVFIRTAAGQTPTQGQRSAGTFLGLLPDIGQALQGHTIYVAVTLRRPKENGSNDVMLRYYAVDRSNGKRVRCKVSENWTTCYTSHFIPVSNKPPNMSYIGIWPDTKGLSRFVDIKRIEVQIDTPFENAVKSPPADSND